MTLTLVARCPATGRFGVAVASSSPAVAARCAFVRAGVGAVASQNVTDPRLGPLLLDLLERGATAEEAVAVAARRPHAAFRQLLAVGRSDGAATWTGARGLGITAEAQGDGAAAAGNLLAHAGVPRAMLDAFARAPGDLGSRLLAALAAGLADGGEAGPVRSAGLLVAGEEAWPLADLRIDWADDPVGMLGAAWDAYLPQMDAYVQRALDPEAAPAFGVPGDP